MKRKTPSSQNASCDADGLRTCIASGLRKPKVEMLRFVVSPDDSPVPDLDEKLPGRGLWLSADRDMLNTACARNLFAKRARRQVRADANLAHRVEGLLAKRCIELLQLARRSGVLTVGSDEVGSRLRAGANGLLVLAADGAPTSRRKMAELAPDLVVRDVLSGDELGSVMGRERIVHALVAEGGLAVRLARDLSRLGGFRSASAAA